ncbi:polyphosphate kinase 2 family protein [Nocardioides sp. dk4132]|uniref:PPK2 family polyphosphate kinase n=1 Tax=unclassified Nocardioides TaxID=2615069 RepID=UPI00129816B4|nr:MULTISPECIES: PPK2 family polyphosphate kinase [unclassified Nocardioides]MQW77247.1 polyphosphate kinase 2 family protein [Nocardioides sp. dk4132]QGA08005.1 polyphosphate kinase 2 family protein [Nocardioides sp. dk884]
MAIAHPTRLAPGPVDLKAFDPGTTPGFDGDKAAGQAALEHLGRELTDLQERLFAHGRVGGRRRLLLVLQGMDTSGKGGTVRKTVGLVDPQGVRTVSFRAPTAEELEHDFLWRVRQVLPPAGDLGVFDRSHYEDVLVARVRRLAEPAEIERRLEAINAFEAELADGGVTIVKCLLHISPHEQLTRLLARLDDPAKHWKFSPDDIDDRARWGEYRLAYEAALSRTNTEAAPWFVVPADRKWYRNLAVAQILLAALREMDLAWPPADFDVDAERARLLGTEPSA